MAKQTFQGRPVVAGDINGKALVSKQPFNPTSSYIENIWGGATDKAPCTDQDNKELFKKDLNGVILCTSQCIGSSMGGAAFMAVAGLGVAPKAMLYSYHIDAVSASGIVMANVWQEKPIITIDQLGDEFLKAVKSGNPIAVKKDGTVEVG
jgi:predicted aconitase with swiveling domain